MNNITIIIDKTELVFAVEVEQDNDHGTPWDEECGHGPVSDWTTRNKRAGEMVLNKDRNKYRYYDFEEACKIAQRDGWGCSDLTGSETAKQKAAVSAMSDFKYLKAWCNDEWSYNWVKVTLLDSEGNQTEVSDTLGGVDTDSIKYHAETMADELASGLHTRFEMIETTVQSFKYF